VRVRYLLLCLAVLLAACSGPRLPFEKQAPLRGPQTALVHPPWEALVKAGPGADKDIDLETLNGPSAQPEPPPAAVAEADPLPDTPKAKPQKAPPISKPGKKGTVIKAVAVPLVTGGKGSGNADLTRAMRQVLRQAGWTVVKTPAKDAITIRGKVTVGAAKGQSQTVKLSWAITTPDGKVLGTISQANDVPAGSLSKGWGENARFASEAAAEGIFKLIQRYR
jgi:hypothetical protein